MIKALHDYYAPILIDSTRMRRTAWTARNGTPGLWGSLPQESREKFLRIALEVEVRCMNTFIYGTSNPAKLASMREMLQSLDVEIKGLNETNADLPDVDESGNTPLENARIKALAYYEALKRPVFACDSGLYIDGLPNDEQPGVHVRMVNGKRLSDDEMVAHYAATAKRLGGKAVARYQNAICLVANADELYEHFDHDIASHTFYIVDTPHTKRVEGFPLDCLSVRIRTGAYYYDETSSRADGDESMSKGFQAFFKRVLKARCDIGILSKTKEDDAK